MFQSKIIVLFSIVFLLFCSCKKSYENEPNYLLRVLSPEKTGISFNNSLTEDEAHSIINYIYFYKLYKKLGVLVV